MAAPTQIPPLNPLIDRGDQEALKDYLNLQAEMEQSIKRQNNSLFEQLGIRQDLSFSITEYFNKVTNLGKKIEDSKNREKELIIGLATIVDETQKRSQLQLINSIKQRREAYASELEMMNKIEALGLLPIIWGISRAYKLFKDLDKSAWEFRKAMGMTRVAAESLQKTINTIAIDYMHVGVTADAAAASMMSLGREMGSIHTVTKDLVKTTAVLKSQLGIVEDDTAGFLKNMAGISKSTMQAQENIAYIAADLSMAAGVPFPLIMKDLATKSGTTLTMMSRLPNQVARAAVELRKMGISLDQAAKSSREILNFSDNINAEMEASVLLGRSINLQRARELAYRRDLEGSTREVLKLTKQIDFANLDVFQQEAFARATGQSVDELMKLVQAEKQWKAARSTPELAGQVAAYEKLRAANQATAKSSAENLKMMIEQRSNQERLTAITQKWNQIVSKAASLFLPIIDGLLSAVIPVMDITKGIVGWGLAFKTIAVSLNVIPPILNLISTGLLRISNFTFPTIGKLSYWMMNFGKVLKDVLVSTAPLFDKLEYLFSLTGKVGSSIGRIVLPIVKFFGQVGSFFSRMIAPVAKFVGFLTSMSKFALPFAKAIPVIGWVITGFQFIVSLVQRFKEFVGKDGVIVGGLKAIGYALKDVLIQPFIDAWNYISSFWSGKSPSKLGLSIVTGIASVGTMIFDALTSPWRNALAWITSKIPGMSGIADKLAGGFSGLLKKPLEARVSTDTKSTITPVGMKVVSEAATQATSATIDSKEKSNTSSDVLLGNILDAINTLNKNLENGKIGFYIDGQLMSATLARQTDFRNGYGVNKARA